ncbi:hypothetical protein HDU98_007666 [Podochytrium sp. JEL0797]|nr:hypothetical protein HDU98_007666 [Podochytrium sp. JEL0797]
MIRKGFQKALQIKMAHPDFQVAIQSEEGVAEHVDEKVLEDVDYPDGGFAAWGVVAASFLAQFIVFGAIYSFGVFNNYYVTNGFGSATDVSLIAGIGFLFVPALAIPAGHLAERYGYRQIVFIGSVLVGLGVFLASFSTKLPALVMTQGVMFGIGGALVFFPAVALPSQWFSKRRGLAQGIGAAGSGVGGLIFSSVLQRLLDTIGLVWTLRAFGIFCLVILLAINPLFKVRIQAKQNAKVEFSILRDPRFTLLLLAAFFANFATFCVATDLPVYATERGNLSDVDAATILSIYNGFAAFGKILLGFCAHNLFGNCNTLTISMWIGAVSAFAWMGASTFGEITAFAAINGTVGGGFWALLPVVIASMFGVEGMMSRVTLLYTALSFGVLLGPIFPAIIQEHFGMSGITIYCGIVALCAAISRSQSICRKMHLHSPLLHAFLASLLASLCAAKYPTYTRVHSLALFGGDNGWKPHAWAIIDDEKSVASVKTTASTLEFHGSLNADESRGHISIVTQKAHSLTWDFTGWDKVVLKVSKGDGNLYSLNFMNADHPTVKFRHLFQTVKGQASTHVVPFRSLKPVIRGQPADGFVLDKGHVNAISLTCSSLFGKQSGEFGIVLESLSLGTNSEVWIPRFCLVLAKRPSQKLELFGGVKLWKPSSWTAIDDRTKNGNSVSKLDFTEKGRVLKFSGSLVYKNDGTKRAWAAVVSDRKQSPKRSASAPIWDFSAWDKLTVNIAKGDGKWYYINLITTDSPSIEYRFAFQTTENKSSMHTVLLSDLIPTQEGIHVTESPAFDKSNIEAISLKCASMFGNQEGPFAVFVQGITLGVLEDKKEREVSENLMHSWSRDEL